MKHVVAEHGGRVKVWSQKGQGSTFTMILPEAYVPEGAQGQVVVDMKGAR